MRPRGFAPASLPGCGLPGGRSFEPAHRSAAVDARIKVPLEHMPEQPRPTLAAGPWAWVRRRGEAAPVRRARRRRRRLELRRRSKPRGLGAELPIVTEQPAKAGSPQRCDGSARVFSSRGESRDQERQLAPENAFHLVRGSPGRTASRPERDSLEGLWARKPFDPRRPVRRSITRRTA
jgi:hypothetical protein